MSSSTESADAQQLLKQDFERVREKLGQIPLRKEYKEYGNYSPKTFAKRLTDTTSFNKAVQFLGYIPRHPGGGRPAADDETFQQDFDRVVQKLGHVPSSREYNEHGEYTATALYKRFTDGGSYNKAVRALGYEPPNSKRGITVEDIKQDFEHVVDTLGHIPSSPEYREHGTYTSSTLTRKVPDAETYSEAVQILST